MCLFIHLCKRWSVLLTQQSYFALLPPSLTLNDSDVDPMNVNIPTQWRMKCVQVFMFQISTIHANQSSVPLSDGVPDFVLALMVSLVVMLLSSYSAVTVMLYSVSATKLVSSVV